MNPTLIARQHEDLVLRMLTFYGWLRTRDLAIVLSERNAFGAPPAAPTFAIAVPSSSAIRVTQRVLRRLRERALVNPANAPDGAVVYTLAEAGVRRVRALGFHTKSGKDLTRSLAWGYYHHRCAANMLALSAWKDRFRVWSEHQVCRGYWPGGALGLNGKKPDVLVSRGCDFWWVEVDRSRPKDEARRLAWLTTTWRPGGYEVEPAQPAVGWNIRQVVFACNHAAAKRISEQLRLAGWPPDCINRRLRFLYGFENPWWKF